MRLVGAESDFATLHKVYGWIVNGVQFTPQSGLAEMISLIDFDTPKNNIFRVVNQFTVEYTNNGRKENRRPDVLLFVNGMPLCVIELKNPADKHSLLERYSTSSPLLSSCLYLRRCKDKARYCPHTL